MELYFPKNEGIGSLDVVVDVASPLSLMNYGSEVVPLSLEGLCMCQINAALDVLKKDEVSVAIFALGWNETNQPPDFTATQNKYGSNLTYVHICLSIRRTQQNFLHEQLTYHPIVQMLAHC